MRIGQFTTEFPYKSPFDCEDEEIMKQSWGGVAEVVYQLTMDLNDQGHSVNVYTISPTDQDIVQKYENITVYRYRRDAQIENTNVSLGLFLKPLAHNLDIIHGHSGTPPGMLSALIYSLFRRKAMITSLHGEYSRSYLSGLFVENAFLKKASMTLYVKLLYSIIMRRSNVVTSVTKFGIDPSRTPRHVVPKSLVVPNGIDLTSVSLDIPKEECRRILGIGQETRVVLFVGNITAIKNPLLLLKAFRNLDFNQLNPSLIMLGDGKLRRQIIEDSIKLGLQDRVFLPGFIRGKEKLLYYKAADVLVLPSESEGFPLVLLEASAFGLPLVVSNLDVFESIVENGYNGLIFASGDEKDLFDKLNMVLRDEKMRSSMGVNAREISERFELSKTLRKYCEIYSRFNIDESGEQRKKAWAPHI